MWSRRAQGGAPIIDITSLFTTNSPTGFALEFKRHYRMAHVDGRRSLIRNVRAFPKNIAIGFYQTWVPDEKDLLKPPKDEDPPPAALGFYFKTNFLLLPEKPMLPAARTSAWAISRCRSTTTAPASTAWSAKPSSRAIAWRRRIPRRGLRTGDADRVLPEPGDSSEVAPLSQAGGGAVARSSGASRDSRTPSSPGMRPPRRKTPTGIRATCATR